ncbi:hypothetical protein Salat_0512900 [Sesamum alatum]|uniref:DUF4283 domain-containing protein n=1 Tax=Sesamum alatum TaxID=300844 RepID=A0AAE1Z402_9LAMI|nr:hypothetical protein Salat_0512900 [Sesamum alatum]
MAEELDNLDKALSFSNDEKHRVVLPLGLWHGDMEPQGLYLVGGDLDISLIKDGRFLFKFNHILDRRRVMEEGPWSFEKNLLVLRTVDDCDNLARVYSELDGLLHSCTRPRLESQDLRDNNFHR